LFFSLLFLGSMFIFINSLYYAISLLFVSVLVLCVLLSNFMISSLTVLIVCIVYLGAIMILVGYVCAICPNFIIGGLFYRLLSPSLALFVLYFSYFPSILPSTSPPLSTTLLDFFYCSSGSFLFLVILLMLFFTLLIVTSQYLTPKGPFRSVTL
jgi:hypothetical protein